MKKNLLLLIFIILFLSTFIDVFLTEKAKKEVAIKSQEILIEKRRISENEAKCFEKHSYIPGEGIPIECMSSSGKCLADIAHEPLFCEISGLLSATTCNALKCYKRKSPFDYFGISPLLGGIISLCAIIYLVKKRILK